MASTSTSEQSQNSSKVVTRKATTLFGLGSGITEEDPVIMGSRLPTGALVLHCMMYHCNTLGHTGTPYRFAAAKIVLEKIRTFYQKGNIPMVSNRRACDKIVALLDSNNKLRSIDKNRRNTPATRLKLEALDNMLKSTFVLWPRNGKALINNAEDRLFLESMKGDRAASLGAFDKKLARKVARVL